MLPEQDILSLNKLINVEICCGRVHHMKIANHCLVVEWGVCLVGLRLEKVQWHCDKEIAKSRRRVGLGCRILFKEIFFSTSLLFSSFSKFYYFKFDVFDIKDAWYQLAFGGTWWQPWHGERVWKETWRKCGDYRPNHCWIQRMDHL